MNELCLRVLLVPVVRGIRGYVKSEKAAENQDADYSGMLVVYCVLLSRNFDAAQILKKLKAITASIPQSIRVGVLVDYADSSVCVSMHDSSTLAPLVACVDDYQQTSNGEWFLFFREREFSRHDNRWTGWERKRGKILSLLKLIQGSDPRGLKVIYGDGRSLRRVRWVLTMDEDNRISERSLRMLALKVNECDRNSDRTGPGILQPAILMNSPSSLACCYERLEYNGVTENNISCPPTNFYSDAFDRASYYGKGVLNVERFLKRTEGYIPDGVALSHDLIEGELASTKYIGDAYICEDIARSAYSRLARAHRWARGDWQLITWAIRGRQLTSREPAAKVDFLTRWKVFDNMQRAIAPIVLYCSLLWVSTLTGYSESLSILLLAVMLLSAGLWDSWNAAAGAGARDLGALDYALVRPAFRGLLNFAVLPVGAVVAVDAILRSQWRLWISKRNLLEWKTFAEAQSTNRAGAFSLGAMVCAIMLSGCFLWTTEYASGSITTGAICVSVVWIIGPVLCDLLSAIKCDGVFGSNGPN